MSGPLTAVLDAIRSGSTSLTEIAARTGLDRDTVEAATGHLVRTGRLDAKELSMGCPSGGCGSCASGASYDDGSSYRPGCGAPGPSAGRRGPVLVALTLRLPERP